MKKLTQSKSQKILDLIKNDDLSNFKLLMQTEASLINHKHLNNTWLYYSINNASISIVQFIINSEEFDYCDDTYLVQAIKTCLYFEYEGKLEQKHLEIVKILLKSAEHLEINLKTSDALRLACRGGQTEIVKILINSPNIDVNHIYTYKSIFSDGTMTAVDVCLGDSQENEEILDILLSLPELDINKTRALYHACMTYDVKLMEKVMKHPKTDIYLNSKLIPHSAIYYPSLAAVPLEKNEILTLFRRHKDFNIEKFLLMDPDLEKHNTIAEMILCG